MAQIRSRPGSLSPERPRRAERGPRWPQDGRGGPQEASGGRAPQVGHDEPKMANRLSNGLP
eukprot:5842912-Pyramimonas_sp.AAC.1